jgi:hypothetical protein
MTRAIVCLLALCSSSLPAQQQPLVGVWQISFPAGARIENGTPTPIMATGVLTVEAKDDSLVADLVTDPSPDLPARPPVRLVAKAGTGDAVFISRSKATIRTNDSAREATVVSTWTIGAKGDTLGGTVERKLEGFDAGSQGPQPVTGTRRKG